MTAIKENVSKLLSIIRSEKEIGVESLVLKAGISPSTYERYKKYIPLLANDVSYNESLRIWTVK
ncbi:hypothetical protein [Nitrososphaeria virus YSH_1032793]|uniref:Uncharacterized protein n=1 Tax=Nitrososphaeria virus YSH_1032793 TaxID=3071320 RepID=A0A976UAC0_9CAUD|nr:hypothetical protein QKV91_gp14 [Yangshan Harbor Nitrososphaeria virus]UVF62218.1 hypothetical protein [Nitrososphaeria virus YSH_1032793]